MAIVGFSGWTQAQTSVSWLSAVSGTWTDASKWSSIPVYPNNGTPSGSTYFATVSASGAPYLVRLSSSATISGLTIDSTAATVLIGGPDTSGGTLTVFGAIDVQNGTLAIGGGGRLRAATVSGSANATFSLTRGSELDAVTLALNTSVVDGVRVYNGLNLSGNRFTLDHPDLSNNAYAPLTFLGSQTVAGNGEFVFEGLYSGDTIVVDQGTVTFGPGVTIRTGAVGGTIGFNGAVAGSRWINQGTIHAQSAGQSLALAGRWRNEGILRLSGGALVLDGTFNTAGIGTVVRTGGELLLSGYLDNSDATLSIDNTAFPLDFGPSTLGTIKGGTITGTQPIQFTKGNLDGVTVAGSLKIPNGIFLRNGLTLVNGTITLGSDLTNGDLAFIGSQPLAGAGRVIFNSYSGSTIRSSDATTFTIGSGITVQSGTSDGFIGGSGGTFINQGTITATNSKLIRIGGAVVWSNQGFINADNGVVELGGLFSTADIGAHATSNGGQIKLTGGTLNNTGATFAARSDDQAIVIGKSLTVLGGTISSVGGASLQISGGSASGGPVVLDGVKLLTDVCVSSQPEVQIKNAQPFTGQIVQIGGDGSLENSIATTLRLSSNGAIAGAATILLADNANLAPFANGSLILGSGITVISDGIGNAIGASAPLGTLINQGLIRANGPAPNNTSFLGRNDGTIIADGAVISAQTTNSGTILAINGGKVHFSGSNSGIVNADQAGLSLQGNLTDVGTMIVSNGTLAVGAITTAQALAVQRLNSPVIISGILNNAGSELPVTGTNGQWELRAGTVAGGSITTADDTSVLLASGSGTIEGSSIYAPVIVAGSTLRLTNNWHNFGTITLNEGTVALQNTWDNQGLINGIGTISTTGSWTLNQLGAFDGTNIAISMGGTINNTNETLDLNSAKAWYLRTGTISGGTISSADHSGVLISASGRNQLIGVTLDANLGATQGTIAIANGIELLNESVISLVSNVPMHTVTGGVTGNGRILLGQNSLAFITGPNTLGANITVNRSSSGTGTLTSSATLTNNGTIASVVAGARIVMLGTLSNAGVISSVNGGSIALPSPSNLLNYSSGTLTGGTWIVGAGSTMTFGSSTITTNNATIVLDGVGSTFAPINQLRTNLGQFTVTNGRDFGAVGSLTNSGTIIVGPGSTLSVVDSFNNLSGLLDLNFKMVVAYGGASPLDELVGQIGSQIISSAVIADPGLAIGSIDDGNVVRLQIVANGDANMDGFVNYEDLTTLASNYSGSNAPPGSLVAVPTSLEDPKWVDGDFNYDGAVNLTDLYALGWQYKDQQHPLTQSLQTLGLPTINVPEPGLGAAAIAVLSVLTARRRRR